MSEELFLYECFFQTLQTLQIIIIIQVRFFECSNSIQNTVKIHLYTDIS